MNPSGSAPSPNPDAQSEFSTVDALRSSADSTVRPMAEVDSHDHSAESRGVAKIRRLIADQQYFGLDALTFHTGAKRMLARVASQGPRQAPIDVRSLGNDFRLDATASRKLLGELLAGGVLHRDDAGGHRATALFREYALACVVAPLSRARAKTLIDRASELAARINANWKRNPHFIQTVAVSGSYMTRRDPLDELSLWIVVRRRPQTQWQRWKPSVSNEDGLRRIGAAMRALSSFVVVRVAADRQKVQRPFTVAFEASDDAMEGPLAGWEKLWETSASFSRRLFLR